ncbi:uncharacterized protein LOC135925660 isoform X2 [Gordionus sp. m RMFG-2023]|uniref:uncharacterized protein LOC135925660 isoform X2 n=1 Tax=Gordionus sp. m RMFG-2023 TaxID=3053472 RepID=UPI0031FC21A5
MSSCDPDKFLQFSHFIDDIKKQHLKSILLRRYIIKMKNDGYKNCHIEPKLKLLYKRGIDECIEEIRLIKKAIGLYHHIFKLNKINNGNQNSNQARIADCQRRSFPIYRNTVCNVLRRGELMQILEVEAAQLPIWNITNSKPPPLCGALPPLSNYISLPGEKVAAYIMGLKPLRKSFNNDYIDPENGSIKHNSIKIISTNDMNSICGNSNFSTESYFHKRVISSKSINTKPIKLALRRLTNTFATPQNQGTHTRRIKLNRTEPFKLQRNAAKIARLNISKHSHHTNVSQSNIHKYSAFMNDECNNEVITNSELLCDWSGDVKKSEHKPKIFYASTPLKHKFQRSVGENDADATMESKNKITCFSQETQLEDENVWILAKVGKFWPSIPRFTNEEYSQTKDSNLKMTPSLKITKSGHCKIKKNSAGALYGGMYEIIDVDESRERYLVNPSNIIPLPCFRADPVNHPKAFYAPGTSVLARYPQTTCFYKALIHEIPSHVDKCYMVIFDDPLYPDGYSPPLPIHQKYIIPFKLST